MKTDRGVNLTVGPYIAAIDMGSNSFHLLIAQLLGSEWTRCFVAERKVQLAAGSASGELDGAAQIRALNCLAEFKQILQPYGAVPLHIVATASLRGMRNADCFCKQVHSLLGVTPEIVSGEQEAELVYLGVCSGAVNLGVEALVVDIGGGSTEFALGRGARMLRGRSVAVGCLSYLRYFPGGRLDQKNFDAAVGAARIEFDRVVAQLVLPAAVNVIGCSGTLVAVEQVLNTRSGRSDGIYRADLQTLILDLRGFDSLDLVNFAGLPADRQSIFGSGLAIVLALFEALNIEMMRVSERGLREGILERCLKA